MRYVSVVACSVDDCPHGAAVVGVCLMHYYRDYRHQTGGVCLSDCCELLRVFQTAVRVSTVEQLRDALTRPEVFYWTVRS